MLIQDIKNQNLICLDFDDCIIPYIDFNTHKQINFGQILKETKKNLKILKKFCYNYNYKVFIMQKTIKIIKIY